MLEAQEVQEAQGYLKLILWTVILGMGLSILTNIVVIAAMIYLVIE